MSTKKKIIVDKKLIDAQRETFTPQAPTQMERVIHGMKRDIDTRMIQINHLSKTGTVDEKDKLKNEVKEVHEYFLRQYESIFGQPLEVNMNKNE